MQVVISDLTVLWFMERAGAPVVPDAAFTTKFFMGLIVAVTAANERNLPSYDSHLRL